MTQAFDPDVRCSRCGGVLVVHPTIHCSGCASPVVVIQAVTQHVSEPASFCRPECEHRLSVYRGRNGRTAGFKPTGNRGVNLKGRAKLCAVAIVDQRPGRHVSYLTVCGETLGASSISHAPPTCTKCRQAMRTQAMPTGSLDKNRSGG